MEQTPKMLNLSLNEAEAKLLSETLRGLDINLKAEQVVLMNLGRLQHPMINLVFKVVSEYEKAFVQPEQQAPSVTDDPAVEQ